MFARTAAPAAAPPFNWGGVLTGLWLTGTIIGFARLAAGLIWAAWIARRSRPLTDSAWTTPLARAAADLGLKRSIPLLMSGRTAVPVTCDSSSPRCWCHGDLMPEQSRRRVVLLHKLAHVKRRDCVVQAMAQMACAVHSFNPLALWTASRLRGEQERACDDLVLCAGTAGPAYAHHLCDIASAAAIATAVIAATAVLPLGAIRFQAGDADASARAATVAVATPLATPAVAAAAPLSTVPASGTTAVPERHSTAALNNAAQSSGRADGMQSFLDDYCTMCHNQKLKIAGVILEASDFDHLGADAGLWEKVLRECVRHHPPPRPPVDPGGTPLIPDKSAVNAFIGTLEAGLDRQDRCGSRPARPLSGPEVAARLAQLFWKSEPNAEQRRSRAARKTERPRHAQGADTAPARRTAQRRFSHRLLREVAVPGECRESHAGAGSFSGVQRQPARRVPEGNRAIRR